MKKTQIFAIAIVTLLSITLIVPSTWAGSRHRRHRHMLHGAAIGIGAFMLGKAIHDQVHRPHSARLPYHSYAPTPPPRPRGHWEVRRVWVPETYKKVWNPGHYNRRHHWVAGHWIEILDQPGYWDEQRVWVATR